MSVVNTRDRSWNHARTSPQTPPASKSLKHFTAANKLLIQDSTLTKVTQELVMLRARQINRCGWCADVHTKELAHAGKTTVRINLVAAWRKAKAFTDPRARRWSRRSQGTRMADGSTGVSDEVCDAAAEHYDEEQLTALVLIIGLINASTRMGVIARLQGGDHKPGVAPDPAAGEQDVMDICERHT